MKLFLSILILVPSLLLAFDPPPTTDVPEPTTLAMLGTGSAIILISRFRKKK